MPIRSRGNCEMTRKRMVQVSSRPDSDALKRNGMQRHAMTWRRKGIVRGGKRPEPSTRHTTQRAESPSLPASQVPSGERSAAPSLPLIQPGPPAPLACRPYFCRDRVRRVLRVVESGRNAFRML